MDNHESVLRSILAELGIVSPGSIDAMYESHRELFDAYRDGKITHAALRQSLSNDPNLIRHANLSDSE